MARRNPEYRPWMPHLEVVDVPLSPARCVLTHDPVERLPIRVKRRSPGGQLVSFLGEFTLL